MAQSISSEFMNRAGNLQLEVFSSQSSNLSSGLFPTGKLDRAFSNFKKSGAPSRFLLFSEDAWMDLAHKVFDELKAGFLAGKIALQVSADGKTYLFNFLYMSRIELDTGRWNSIAWIDVNGRCFFPANAVDERKNLSQEKKELGLRIIKKDHVDCTQEHCDESAEVSSDRWPDTKLLREDETFYKVVEKLFLSGIKRFIPDTFITSIHRCLHSSFSGNSRLSYFQLHKRLTREARGNSNVKFGWYGTSASNVATIMSYGFRQSNSGQLGVSAHGHGIHLLPPHSPYWSALLSEADEDGERHVVLCRVIMGNSEKVEAGSIQDHSSNGEFDTGVDDPVNPKWYVVWSSQMNTHIIPEYVVSFKSSRHSQGLRKPMVVQKFSSVTNLPFWKLFAEIGRCLPSSKMQALEIVYNLYKVGKISKEIFIRYMRSIAGVQLLTTSIKRMRAC